MATKPTATPKPAPTAHDAEVSPESAVSTVEVAVDAWLTHKDTAQPQVVPLPRSPALDDAGHAELARRYTAIGWAGAIVKDGALHLMPAAVGE